ncbi:unnamed protein product [Enterobius vermicularis]|uniref:Hpt domain-containing protein n=1 Tax=Enterobius vermicularis TaxID=51028 RepID=A0A0N4V3J3_ENTVE|nr:unnamed protein product [Enterobius vermicularis]
MKKLEFLEKKLLEQVAEYKSTGKFSEYNDSLVARGGEEIEKASSPTHMLRGMEKQSSLQKELQSSTRLDLYDKEIQALLKEKGCSYENYSPFFAVKN